MFSHESLEYQIKQIDIKRHHTDTIVAMAAIILVKILFNWYLRSINRV